MQEENLRRLHEISEGIMQLRHLNSTQLQVQDGRRENLQKFSTSCPSLNKPQNGSTLANHNSDYYRSLLDIQQDSTVATPSGDTIPDMDYTNAGHSEVQVVEPDVRICINDVTLESTDDFVHQSDSPNHYKVDENLIIEHYRKHPRRKSWCHEKTNVEKKEFRNKMLSLSNKSLSLSSLDGQDDTEDENEEERLDDSNEMQSADQSQSSVGKASESSLNSTQNFTDLPNSLLPTANSTPSENNSRLTPNRNLSSASATSARSMSDVRLALDEAADQEAGDTSVVMPPFGRGHHSDMSNSRGSLVLTGHSTLVKSVSTPSLASLKEDDKTKVEERRPGTINEVSWEGKSATRQSEDGVDEDEALNKLLQTDQRRKARMSMIEFLNNTNNFEDAGEQKQEIKEEKKRRSSVFSKFGSYRQKKLREKELKSRSTHQFVSVSFSNSKACDVCRRSMANKAALQCEHCMLNVHDSCKDQITVCTKYREPRKLPKRTPSAPSVEARDRMTRFQSNSLPPNNVFSVPTDHSVKMSQSFRETKRALSVPSRSMYQHSLSTSALLPKNQNQRASSPSKVISEEREKEKEQEAAIHPVSNMTETFSVSVESLDDGTSEVQDFEDDPVLMIKAEEAEAWSVTVDKKTLKKMSAKDIKRQDHIWEFIQTEKSHCRTLKIMQKIFSHGILHELNMSQEVIDRLFPRLDDLLDIHLTFLRKLRERQQLRPDKSIDEIGDILIQQFDGEMGTRMKEAYGEFCSRHNKAVDYYKEILKSERKFQIFVKKCSFNEVCKKLDIPACILLVTQRMTKYPLLIEPIIKTTKGKAIKYVQRLQHALVLTRDILDYVDAQIDECEKEERLHNICYKMDPRSFAMYKGKKFKKSDILLNGKRKLIHEGVVSWKSARGKTTECTALLLSDLIFFIQESNQKYVFYSQDNKSSVISLAKLLIREKGDTRDSKGIYLICQSKRNPEMYEIVCKTQEERKQWISIIRSSIAKCPEEEEVIPAENEEEIRLIEERSSRLRQLIDVLKQKDLMIKSCCEDKMKAVGDMMEIFGFRGIMNNLKSVHKDEEKTQFRDLEDLLLAAVQEASRLSMMLRSQTVTSTLSRSVSSAGEHTSATCVPPPLPKRAETFGGFEGKDYPKGLASMSANSKRRHPTGPTDADGKNDSLQNLENPEGENELLMLTVDGNSSKLLTHRRGSTGQPGPNENSKSTNKEKINRRLSTSFLQSLLIKQHTEREESDTRLSDRSSDQGSWGELSSGSSNTSMNCTHHAGPHIDREQCTSLIHLMHYLHTVMSLSAQQKTQMESLKAQFSEASRKLSKLGSDSERRGIYHHDKQLEELRNLQETINREREVWENEKEKGKTHIEEERGDIEQMRGDIAKQQEELRLQREELQRQREALQKQIDFYEQQKNSDPPIAAEVSTGSKSSDPHVPNGRRSLDVLATVTSYSRTQIEVVHKRSASDDIQSVSRQGVHFEPAQTDYSGSLKEPLNSNRELKPRPHSISSTTSSSHTGVARRDSQLPIHLLSATNEQKIKQVKQHFPVKLLHGHSSGVTSSTSSGGSNASSGNTDGDGGGSGNSGPQQMLSMKLLGLSQTGGNLHGGGTQKSTLGSHPVLKKSTSNVQISKNSNRPPNRLTYTHSTPSFISKSRTLQSPPPTQTLLPMKLAEGSALQRAKSASPKIMPRHGSASTNSTTSPPHHGQLDAHKSSGIKEEEIIYF